MSSRLRPEMHMQEAASSAGGTEDIHSNFPSWSILVRCNCTTEDLYGYFDMLPSENSRLRDIVGIIAWPI